MNDIQGISDERLIKVIDTAINCALQAESAPGTVSVLVTDEDGIRQLNCKYRNIDSVTDVLSFAAREGEQFCSRCDFWGDIVICDKRAREQAAEFGHSVEREYAFLTVHGVLHLLGYDHMQKQDEEKMFRRQEEILQGAGFFRG